MILYFFIFLVLLFSSLVNKGRYLSFTLLVFLILLAGLRSKNCGMDTYTYYNVFTHAESYRHLTEPGYFFINYVIKKIYNNFNFYLFIVSSLTLGITYYVSKKNSSNVAFSIFIYYGLCIYLNSLNMMRQMLAMAFVLMFFYFFLKKKYKRAILFYLIATSVHLSAFVSIVVIIFNKFNFSYYHFIIGIIVSFLLGLFFNETMFSLLAGKYAIYLELGHDNFRHDRLSSALSAMIMNIFFLGSLHFTKKVTINNYWTKILFAGILLMNVTQSLVLGTRLILYFTQVQIIYYPNYIYTKRKEKMFWFIIILIYISIIFYRILYASYLFGNAVPYSSIFEL